MRSDSPHDADINADRPLSLQRPMPSNVMSLLNVQRMNGTVSSQTTAPSNAPIEILILRVSTCFTCYRTTWCTLSKILFCFLNYQSMYISGSVLST